ncbi:methionyl-tRNA formyltransferase [Thiohalorhabdus methylotrophus]|uniref:Methionyl-tRNA formyltransferase n=1 Tax=Thiohalorhabdus methylotrophus TaxID=3242694 RepID=A0ABV4TPM6_9GAMM
MRIAFAGTPEFAVPSLRALLEGPDSVVGVLTQPDRPAGRGRKLRPSPVKEAAQAAGLPVAQPEHLKGEEERAPLREWAPDLLVVTAYGLLLPRTVLELPRLGCINVHASLLPAYRGAAPIQRAILDGVAETGVTIMQMEAGLDSGPMLLRRARSMGSRETAGELHDALAALGAEALSEALDGLRAGTLEPRPQDPEHATYAPKITKAEAELDWSRSAAELDRRVRAFNPWPVAFTLHEGASLRIWRARPVAEGPAGSPGTVGTDAGGRPLVACGEGGLRLEEVQPPGRKRMEAAAALRGGHLRAGDRLGGD